MQDGSVAKVTKGIYLHFGEGDDDALLCIVTARGERVMLESAEGDAGCIGIFHHITASQLDALVAATAAAGIQIA